MMILIAAAARVFLVAAAASVIVVGAVPSGAVAAESASAEKTAAELFQISKVWSLHLNVPADEWAKMEPQGDPRGGPGPGDFGPPGDPPTDGQRPPGPGHGPGGFGLPRRMEFRFGRASVEFEGRTYADVGVRFKGNSSYMSAVNSLKKSIKLDFDHYQDQQRFYGLSKINLNNNTMDPSQMRDAIAYDVFRRAEIPAPRTTFTRLFLTVPGKYDRKYIGLYTMVEQVDKKFLQDRFGSDKGMLLKPRIGRVLPYLGEKWDDYQSSYVPKSGASKAATKRLIACAKLVQQSDDATFRRDIENFVDVDEFLKFIALNGALGNLDSILAMGQNYYMVLDPASNKFVWIPWDLNMALAGFPMAGSAAEQMDLSIRHPHSGEIKLIERLLAVKEFDETYRRQLREILASNFTVERIGGLIDQIGTAIREAVQEDTHLKLAAFERALEAEDASRPPAADDGPPSSSAPSLVAAVVSRVRDALPGPPFRQAPALRPFIAGRVTSLSAQLDGQREGYVPVRGPAPGGFGPGRFLGPQILAAADTDKSGRISPPEFEALANRWFAAWDEDKSGSLSDKQLADGLNELFGPPPGFGRRGEEDGTSNDDLPANSPSGRRRPPFGPGMFLAPQLLKLADRDGDSQLTLGELGALFVKWFAEWEKNNDGGLDADELSDGLGKTLIPPGGPGFRPRGGAR